MTAARPTSGRPPWARDAALGSALAGALALVLAVPPSAAAGEAAASPWFEHAEARMRMIAGEVKRDTGGERLTAGVEIRLGTDWKTYWRTPGDSGGVPPGFDWSGSVNVAAARVLYPAPLRFKDAMGDSVGYKKHVVFPVEVTPKEAGKPVMLKLALELGICKDICIPIEARLELPLGGKPAPLPAENVELLKRFASLVPAREGNPRLPAVRKLEATLDGDKPQLVIEAAFPAGKAGADVFIEAPDGIYLPLPQKAGDAGDGGLRFVVDLSQGAEPANLRNKDVVITLVGDGGNAEVVRRIQ